MKTHLHHGRPRSRREFLASGVLGFSGAVTGWHLLGGTSFWRSSSVLAAEPKALMPFLVFDLAGGAALPGNFLVGGPGGPEDLLTSYSTLGWDPRQARSLDRRFGLPMAGNDVSKMLTGMLAVMSPEAQANLRLASVLHFGQDDTNNNPLSLLGLVSKAGLTGSALEPGLGTLATLSGGNSDAVLKSLVYQPLAVGNLDDILNANEVGTVLGGLSLELRRTIASAVNRIAGAQSAKYASLAPSLQGIAAKAYGGVDHALLPHDDMDPRIDPAAREIYGISPQSAVTDQNVVFAGIVRSVLTGQSGPGAITIGGCDYHDGTDTSGDAKDTEIGREIGRAVELARRLQKPLFFQIITDGGIYSFEGTRKWAGDAGNKSMSVFGCYLPDGPAQYRNPQGGMQLGSYTNGQGVNMDTLVGGKPALASYAVFANYLQLCSRVDEFEKHAGRVFSMEQLESVLVFA